MTIINKDLDVANEVKDIWDVLVETVEPSCANRLEEF